jgi:hypothetical protein
VIHEIDDALRTLIKREALRGTDVEVVFDAPTKDWSTRRNAPTIDVYLYDIREDLRRREMARIEMRDNDGRVVSRHEPPHWYKLSYLVTAWTQRPEDEHRLLAGTLQCFLRHQMLPTDVLVGSLEGLQLPIPITCALPPPEDRALSDVWSALGGELKPSLDVVLIAPFDVDTVIEVGPPVLEGPLLVVAAGAPSGAGTDQRDRAQEPASASNPRRGRRRGAGAGATLSGKSDLDDAADIPAASEERIGGDRDLPGRRLRITEIRK